MLEFYEEELLRDFDLMMDIEENIYEGDVNPAFSQGVALDPAVQIALEGIEAAPMITDNNLNLPSITMEQVVKMLVKMNFLIRNQNSMA